MIVRVSQFLGQPLDATLAMDQEWWQAAQRVEAKHWTSETELLARILETLQGFVYVFVQSKSKTSIPQPDVHVPRPWDKPKEPVRLRPLDFAKTQVPPKRRKGVTDGD